MAIVTISSNVKLNGSAVSARFTSITLEDTHYPVEVQGHVALLKAITFTTRGRGMNASKVASLGAIAASFVARGPRRTLGGNTDAVVNAGAELVKVAFDAAQVVYGYIEVQASVAGANENVMITVTPVHRLRFVGSTDYVEPNA